MNSRRVTYRKLYIGIIAVLTAVAAVSYAIELFTSRPLFSIPSFSVHYAVSFPFILLSIVCNCCVAMLMNSSRARKLNLPGKLLVEGGAVVLIAVFLVIIVNLPFITDKPASLNLYGQHVKQHCHVEAACIQDLCKAFQNIFRTYYKHGTPGHPGTRLAIGPVDNVDSLL